MNTVRITCLPMNMYTKSNNMQRIGKEHKMKNIISKSKTRRAGAVVTAAALSVLSVGAVWGDGLQGGKLALALFLSVFAGILLVWDTEIGEKLSIAVFFALPFGALCCMEFYTHVPWDLTFLITVLNYLFYLILYGVWTTVFGSSRVGCVLGPVIPMIAGLANYFVVSFRSSPIVPWDIFSLGTATSVTDNYSFTLNFRIVFVLLGFAYLMILGEKTRIKIRKLHIRMVSICLSVLLMAGYVTAIQVESVENAFGMDDILFTPNVLYRNNGFMAAFFANLRYLNVEKPENYSAGRAQEIQESLDKNGKEQKTDLSDMPNLFVIMNEAFSDLSIYGDFGISEDAMPFLHSLKENTVRGNLYVSVKGGNTANTEFEFLTGNSMAFMPAGSVPYQQFLKGKTPSLASHLKKLGYRTAALHPYYANGWNRNQVYPDMGFENTYFKDDFSGASTLRGYIDDASAFGKLIQLYEDKEQTERLFAFEVTMQNHGGYSKEYADLHPEIYLTDIPDEQKGTQVQSTEKYLTLIRKTDEAFEAFLNYFKEQQEKTIVVMFGDHQPSDYICNPILRALGSSEASREASLEEFSKGYVVPFVIWANYEMEEEEVDAISVNYLSALLMEKAGIPKTRYQEYLTELRKDYPVVTANFFQTADGKFYDYADTEQKDGLNNYAILQYNDIVDKTNRLEGFFGD